MGNLAQKPDQTWSRQAEPEDSWDRPVRMLYLVTIEVRDPLGSRVFYVLARNYNNAEALQRAFDGAGLIEPAFDGAAAVDVSFEPDVFGYLKLYGRPL